MVTNIEPLFLETISPDVRKHLVAERLHAMRGRLPQVIPRLRALVEGMPRDNDSDIVAVGLLWAELLHLDEECLDALSVFKSVVQSRQAALTTAGQLAISDNLSLLQSASLSIEGAATFYHLVDRRRAAQFEWLNSSDLLDAQVAMEKHNYNEALPPLWRNLFRANALGNWRVSRAAAERYGTLCLRLGALEEATHFLFAAEAKNLETPIADALGYRKDARLVHAVLNRLVTYANLRRHFIIACGLLAKISDLIADDDVTRVAEWLLPRCRELPVRNGGGVMRAAWEMLGEIGSRVPAELSKTLLEAAVSHPTWNEMPLGEKYVLPNRKEIIEAVISLSESAPTEFLPEIADAAIPLATNRMQSYDYAAAVALLCHLAERGGPALKSKIAAALYVPGKAVSRILAQQASFFGVEALTREQWEAFAEKVIQETALMVQRLKPGEAAQSVPESLMTMNENTEWGQLHVSIGGGVGLEGLAREKQKLSDSTIARIIHVVVEMATNHDNVLTNREQLLSQLCAFADRADEVLRREVAAAIEPIARGDVLGPPEPRDAAAVPRSRALARSGMGTAEGVRAAALVALAKFTASDEASRRRTSETLAEGFVHPSEKVRSGAYAAARRLPGLSADEMLPILMGLRDPDPAAAAAAFMAFAVRKEWTLTLAMWKLFLLAARLASQSAEPSLRRHAAFALRSMLDHVPEHAISNDAELILDVFGNDVSWSVREAARGSR